ncbi:MAG TPA: glycine--tRNA ligase subunit beta [Burkholderiales bacterium]|nr:glycine--tRNA ligase subunit beta [Burkholderiales bacterium]
MPKNKHAAPAPGTLLVELLTEELPPKSLLRMAEVFRDALASGLSGSSLLARPHSARCFASPRRLAVLIPNAASHAADVHTDTSGPPVAAGPKAAEGFAKKHGVAVEALKRVSTDKGEVYVASYITKGAHLHEVLAHKVEDALKALPIPKVMRWGSGSAQFVRPVHGLVMMHGKRVVPGSVLGLSAGDTTSGHRFMGPASIRLGNADAYEEKLRKAGQVIADYAARRAEIDRQLQAEAKRQRATLGEYQELLDEVTALVEFPSVYVCGFEASFLEVPHECLILTMRQNQKYFPLFASDGKLLPKFLVVSNMQVKDPRAIVGGNERVVRPRLEDARFFFDQDRKIRLETRVPQLSKVVYHNKLGSQFDRVQRIKLVAGDIARKLGASFMQAERAADLSKADLLTGMVGEFPELQGTMGRYYALHDGEQQEVADAIEQHYRPRFAGDALPQGPVASSVALADKLDTLAGLFGVGQQPTGEKDPFGLRRAALGLIRIVVENQLPLSLHDLVSAAFAAYSGTISDAHSDLETFVFDRFSGYLKELGFSTLEIDAVLSLRPVQLSQVPRQLEAVRAFQALPEAGSLAAANKRVANILKQAAAKGESFRKADKDGLKEPAEIALHIALSTASSRAHPLLERKDYAGYLKTFAVLKAPVDAFFDSVMVMVEEEALRKNRLALLADLREAMNRIADISKLAVEK